MPETEPSGEVSDENRKLSRLLTCLTLIGLFAVLSISINVFEFAEGYSEIRPENLFPIVGGLLLGPLGALSCAIGNFLGDLGNLASAWILNVGTQLFAGTWYESLMQASFVNNTIFSIAFGLPLFIVLTSEKNLEL